MGRHPHLMSGSQRVAFVYPGRVDGADLRHISGGGRLVNLAQVAAAGGHEVTVVATGPRRERLELPCGLPCLIEPESAEGGLTDFFGPGRRLVEGLAPELERRGIRTLVFYGSTVRLTVPLWRYARRSRVRLIASVNEWGHWGEQSASTYWLLRSGIGFVARRFDGVIAISRMMEAYFQRFPRLAVSRIPSIFDLGQLPPVDPQVWDRVVDRDRIVLAYAGTIAGNKDATANVVRALALLPSAQRDRFVLRLYGSDEAQLTQALGEDAGRVYSSVRGCLDWRGFVPRGELQPQLCEADYTVLLRPDEPYANAAFPTKLAESLALGVPAIANLTSDIGEFLQDGVQGHIVADETPRACARVLGEIADRHRHPNRAMRIAAHDTGRRGFDLRSHIDAMHAVLTAADR